MACHVLIYKQNEKRETRTTASTTSKVKTKYQTTSGDVYGIALLAIIIFINLI